MKRALLSGLACLVLLPLTGGATQDLYVNNGSVVNPQVDAVNLVNKGYFQAVGTLPYESWNTLNFTNQVGTYAGSGLMEGTPGFRFSTTSSATGQRTMASSFFNDNGALVAAIDSPVYYFYACTLAPVGPSHLIVSATNIVVKGGTSGSPKASLIVGANGEMELTGKNVDLSRSGLEVRPVWQEPVGVTIVNNTNYFPDIAFSDVYWARTNFTQEYRLYSAGLWDGGTACAQGVPYPEAQPSGAPGWCISGPVADSYISVLGMMNITITNQTGDEEEVLLATNVAKGAIFIGLPAGFAVQPGFSGGDNTVDTGLMTAGALMGVQITNVVTTQMEWAYLYIDDRLASGGTTGLLGNLIGCPPTATFEPANYFVTRYPFYPGAPGNNGYPEPYFFLDSGNMDPNIMSDEVTNSVVQGGEYSAYSAYVDNVVSRPLPVAGGTVTNLPGRIRISADALNMSGTRMRAEGEVILQTSHLISSSNAVVDCENLSFTLASTNGTLKVQSLSKDSVNRLSGPIRLWSAVWSNTCVVILYNYNVDTNGTATPAPITNSFTVSYHAFMIDATSLQTTLPVTVHGFTTHTTNVVIGDNMSIAESLLIDGESLTLDGDVTIAGAVPVVNPILGYPPPGDPLENWGAVNAPNLLYFTNHGYFFIYNEAHFGDDRTRPYSSFVNTGTIDGWSVHLSSDYFQQNGTLLSLGPLFMQCASGKLESGDSSSGGDSQFLSTTLKFNNYQMTVNGGLYLRVTNALFDAGGSSANTFTVQNGFNLQNKPATGDLLGTTIKTVAPAVPGIAIDHTWAGADLGLSASGYTNNTALGKLILQTQSPFPWFYFSGTDAQNGLYVDVLDLSALGNNFQQVQSRLAIDPTLTIYYAAAKLGFTPPPNGVGTPQQPEEYLDGQFGGRLRWVQAFAGPGSSSTVLSNGVTILVNKALRNSKIIDSNANGVPNYYDATPFDTAPLVLTASLVQTNQPPANAVAIAWAAAPNSKYNVYYSTNPFSASWQLLMKYTNSTASPVRATVWDSETAVNGSKRFYRVSKSP